MATWASMEKQIGSLLREYNETMRQGGELLLKAATARLEAEKAQADFEDMKADAYAIEGYSSNTDVRFGSRAKPQEALDDNRWFISRHPGYGAEATACFAKAAAIMASIQWLTVRLHRTGGSY